MVMERKQILEREKCGGGRRDSLSGRKREEKGTMEDEADDGVEVEA